MAQEEKVPVFQDVNHFFRIQFQNGPVKEHGVNGCQIEDIIENVLLPRLNALNERFKCRENALAITKLEETLLWLNRRTQNRIAKGVEGTDAKH